MRWLDVSSTQWTWIWLKFWEIVKDRKAVDGAAKSLIWLSDWTAARSLQSSPSEAEAVKKRLSGHFSPEMLAGMCSSPSLQTTEPEANSSWLYLSPEVNSKPGVGWRIHRHRC